MKWVENYSKSTKIALDDVNRKLLQWWNMDAFFWTSEEIDNKMWLTKNCKTPCCSKTMPKFKESISYIHIFLNSEGPVVQVAIPKGRSITGHVYKNSVPREVKKVKKHYKRKRPKSGIRNIRLLHDNAPAHKSQIVKSFLEKANVPVLPHPPYIHPTCLPLTIFFS